MKINEIKKIEVNLMIIEISIQRRKKKLIIKNLSEFSSSNILEPVNLNDIVFFNLILSLCMLQQCHLWFQFSKK